MSIQTRRTIIAIILCISLSLLIGCTNKDKTEHKIALKEQLIAAFEQQAEIENYRFSGHADLAIDWPAFSGKQLAPLTSSFIAMFASSSMQWHGVSDLTSRRMEIDLQVQPSSLQTTFNIPTLINNSKLYLQLPLFAADEDEYLSYDLQDYGSQLPFASLVTQLTSTLDEEHFTAVEQGDDTVVGIHVTQDNIAELRSALLASLPSVIDELIGSKLINEQLAELWRHELEQIEERFTITTIDEPGLISFQIDEQGYIVAQQVQLYFDNQVVDIALTFSDINQASDAFEKLLPEKVRPIEPLIEQFR